MPGSTLNGNHSIQLVYRAIYRCYTDICTTQAVRHGTDVVGKLCCHSSGQASVKSLLVGRVQSWTAHRVNALLACALRQVGAEVLERLARA